MRETSHISEIIPSTIKSFGEDFYNKYIRNAIIFNWKKIVGEANAKKIRPLHISYKKLYVYCSDSSWKSAMYAYKSGFIQKINDYAQEDVVDDIIFSKDTNGAKEIYNASKVQNQSTSDFQDVKKMILSEDELEYIKHSCECIDNDELREAAYKAAISHAKLDKYRRKNGWHDCPSCGIICPPEDKICGDCRRLRYEKFEKAMIHLLNEAPGLTYAEIRTAFKKDMPHLLCECLPEVVERIRGTMISSLCQSINLNDVNQVHKLVMLFKCVRAENLSEQIIKNALYELRYDLPMKGRWKFER